MRVGTANAGAEWEKFGSGGNKEKGRYIVMERSRGKDNWHRTGKVQVILVRRWRMKRMKGMSVC